MTNPPISYSPGRWPCNPQNIFDALLAEVPWVNVTEAREECFMAGVQGLPYTYGGGIGARTYHSTPWTPTVEWIHEDIGASILTDVCFLNLYRTERNALGWHADDSPEVDQRSPIFVVSFGETRDIWFRPRGHKGGHTHKQTLEPGSILTMLPGMQGTWDHRIPKNPAACGPRISLTFRKMQLVKPFND